MILGAVKGWLTFLLQLIESENYVWNVLLD